MRNLICQKTDISRRGVVVAVGAEEVVEQVAEPVVKPVVELVA